jgi:hypothetical protein
MVIGGSNLFLRRPCPYCRDEPSRPYYIHDAREIVGEHVQRHFGGPAGQRLHQEVGCSHPGLDRSEGMLDRLSRWRIFPGCSSAGAERPREHAHARSA